MEKKNKVITKEFILRSIIFVVIIAIGTSLGLFLGNKLGFVGITEGKPLEPKDIIHDTNLIVGQKFPNTQVENLSRNRFNLDFLINGEKTLLCFVSNGCEPCLEFVDEMTENSAYTNSDYKPVLITMDLEFYDENYNFTAYRPMVDFLNAQSIHKYPTLIGIDQNRVIKFIIPGLSSFIDPDFIDKYL